MRRSTVPLLALLASVAALPALVDAQEADGFDASIQSGTCDAPTDRLRVELKSRRDADVEPYLAQPTGGGEPVELGYLGTSEVPGFAVSVVHTDEPFSLVVTAAGGGDPVACGALLPPEADDPAEAGLALVQLLPVGGSTVQGVAVIQRRPLERERDITPTTARIVLVDDVPVGGPEPPVEGFDGFIQSGTCAAPTDRVRTNLIWRGDHDVRPFFADVDGGPPAIVAYYGAPRAPGFGLAVAHTDQEFSLVVSDTRERTPLACGDILAPDDDRFTETGLALVRLAAADGAAVNGMAMIERIGMERELDVIPTRVRIVVFAPPIET
jgi:hypothetical protein